MKKLIFLFFFGFMVFSCSEDSDYFNQTETTPTLETRSKKPKVNVCHYNAKTGESHTITISENALSAHLAHGDYVGECSDCSISVSKVDTIGLGHDSVEIVLSDMVFNGEGDAGFFYATQIICYINDDGESIVIFRTWWTLSDDVGNIALTISDEIQSIPCPDPPIDVLPTSNSCVETLTYIAEQNGLVLVEF